MRTHTYSPPSVTVVNPGDGNRLIISTWQDGEQVILVLSEAAAKEVGRLLVSATVETFSELPPGIAGL